MELEHSTYVCSGGLYVLLTEERSVPPTYRGIGHPGAGGGRYCGQTGTRVCQVVEAWGQGHGTAAW